MTFYEDIIPVLKDDSFDMKKWTTKKMEIANTHSLKTIPSNIDILLHIPDDQVSLVKAKLLTKPTRTISGVSPVAIMTAPSRCPHGKCTYCPGGINSPWGDVPQSYTGHEPATMRGMRNDYDAYLQVFNRLEQYVLLGHTFDKIEIIVMGGTFTAAAQEYQEEFILGTFKAMNDFSDTFFENGKFDFPKFKRFFELPGEMYSKERASNIKSKLLEMKPKNIISLEEEQLRNESSHVRCVALCIETKPDWGLLKEGNEMLRQGCTRVELGIQSVYNDVLKEVHRGHDSAISIKSIQVLRDLGFKINFHYMPGLPLTDEERDVKGMRELFFNPDYKPDMIKFYPCMVAEGTPLYHKFKKGEFQPITTDEAAKRIAEIIPDIPEYCRIQRVQRDVPTKYWEAGVDRTNLRQYMDQTYGVKSRDIRAREPKGRIINWDKVELKIIEFNASGSKEFFIAAEDVSQDIIIGFCRLRFPKELLREEITKDSALIRELHVYGTATALGNKGQVQHKGWGQKLMQKAEEISKEHGKKKIVVISGVGVRKYYEQKLRYTKEGPYMVKKL
ncbi:tRNA uridine(34) 5-carboxymethylaminomethyl modification radical SAM/GNAT enzyme Elp3 [Candidatus Woesearchaeota archaeon]|jgi:elongator complex protein 3|nr:tRNA uridine(34) 5-carboxymethylaminomethyl modification radical SAM/GNAT enzyme Elp3 [Candidatus Woesearchaeota archaeon]MBT4151360.1 tRNA uridine(34) 5-carboxymethylaminomethyl modification radical SAM/GNAT enzyme Elp3 [Candidatus Woesearchaeota archaeon]MBT4247758.1 tRNA uridine(34) 5-carboxymethylaminomethyl modification radical SAM/GNAT enzyme Elp3 [Candidatus Woesearchaeota archaeon]MBT4434182.1 tRNA uridine(34) 5-carboxymethylaminomethyl modification radical SAM/GNAT enzyme Elp3 [Candi